LLLLLAFPGDILLDIELAITKIIMTADTPRLNLASILTRDVT
jgi:hypothetical protein